jgi:hypothetical protein
MQLVSSSLWVIMWGYIIHVDIMGPLGFQSTDTYPQSGLVPTNSQLWTIIVRYLRASLSTCSWVLCATVHRQERSRRLRDTISLTISPSLQVLLCIASADLFLAWSGLWAAAEGTDTGLRLLWAGKAGTAVVYLVWTSPHAIRPRRGRCIF